MNKLPGVTPGSRQWLRKERRLLTATELGRLQGLEVDADRLRSLTPGELQDLVGNAFCALTLVVVQERCVKLYIVL